MTEHDKSLWIMILIQYDGDRMLQNDLIWIVAVALTSRVDASDRTFALLPKNR